MFAVPLQGFAAASMLFCGQETSHHAQATAHQHPPGSPAHDHAQQQPDIETSGKSVVKPGDGKAAADLLHKCNVCASCCNAAGIPPAALVVAPALLLQADFGSPSPAVHSRPLLVPDKPPRA